MPKIADIQETPNPNAVKFILREPVSNGSSSSYASAEAAKDDALANSIFEVGNVVSVFYMDRMITIEKTPESDWDEVLPLLAVPIREAKATQNTVRNGNAASAVGGAIAAAASEDPVVADINAILDERIRPYLASDGGWLEIVSLEENILTVSYQGACGSCPSSLTGTLMAIENLIHEEIDQNIEVVVV
ncbi:MAG: NifU family protein [Pyrinomonadaceae bacterium]